MDLLFMLIISYLAGFFSTMNIGVNSIKDIRFHLNDVYMVSLMVGLMLFFSIILNNIFNNNNIHNNHNNSHMWLIFSIIMTAMSFMFIRKQILINDSEFLKSMIVHHSYAIHMASKIRDKTTNPEILNLTKDIINTQNNEIKIMNNIYKKLINQ